jgi:hypothetical protein
VPAPGIRSRCRLKGLLTGNWELVNVLRGVDRWRFAGRKPYCRSGGCYEARPVATIYS